jgi:thiol:disulfide interchange protein
MNVRFILNICVMAVFWLASAANAAHTQARIVLAAGTVQPGTNLMAGIHLRMDPEWHTYWKNSGASGIPTTIQWELPPGVTAGEIQWPVPKKLPPDDLVTYVYEHEVVLLVPLRLAPDLKPGSHTLKAKVAWLECKELCIPGNASLEASLTIANASVASADAALIQTWQGRLPKPATNLDVRGWWEKPQSEKLRPVVLQWTAAQAGAEADFYPFASDDFEVQSAVERLPSEAGKILLRKTVKKFEGAWPTELSGLLVQKQDGEKIAFEATVPIAVEVPPGMEGVSANTGSAPTTSGLAQPLWRMLLYAFIGGLILNIMPCVLPVIALKILGFVSESHSDPARIRKLGLVYGLGVLASFLALAALVIGVKAAGHQAGWGMQFGNPLFLVGLTVLITLVALSLFGVFEINLGARVMGNAGTLASKQGSAGAFFNGVLATILATPCTAPFLGVALGFAFAQPAAMNVLIFLTVGAGLAFPYVVLSFRPAWLKFLPKPGAWMERFKIAMGFPMLATAVWLFSLIPAHYGKQAWWLAMFLVVVALASWVYGEFVQRGRTHRGIGVGVTIALLVFGYAYVLENELNWRQPAGQIGGATLDRQDPEGIPWQPWTADAVASAQAEGRPVLVDFTADWCLICEANKKFALETPSVRGKLRELNAVSLLGDYTLLPPVITAELQRYGRSGVPLVLVYPGKPGAAPETLPATLTPGIVLNALERARQKNS